MTCYLFAIQTGVVDPYDYTWQGMPFTVFLQLIVLFTTWAAIPLLLLSKTYDVSQSRTIRRSLVMQLLVYILPVLIY